MKLSLTLLSLIVGIASCSEESDFVVQSTIVNPASQWNPWNCPFLSHAQVEEIRGRYLPSPNNAFRYHTKVTYDDAFTQAPQFTRIDIVNGELLLGRVHTIEHNYCNDYVVNEYFNMEYVPFYKNNLKMMARGITLGFGNDVDISVGTIVSELAELNVRVKNVGNFVPISSLTFQTGTVYEFSAVSYDYNDDDNYNYKVEIEFLDITRPNAVMFDYFQKNEGHLLSQERTTDLTFPPSIFVSSYNIKINVVLDGQVFQSYTKTVYKQ